MLHDSLRFAQSGDLDYFKQQCACNLSKNKLLEISHHKSGDTLVHLAARHGHLHLLSFLLKEGFAKDIGNFDGKRPLHEAAQSGQTKCVELLLKTNVAVDSLKRADW